MTSYVTPKKGFPFICYVGLVSQSTGQFQSNPTLAAGDFKVSKDGAALSNLATLPAVAPASSKSVKISLDSDETNADNIVIIGSDAAGAEWDDIFLNIQTTVSQIDDLALASGIPSAATIADAVWDEDATGHQTLGTFGQAIGDPVSDSDTIWDLVNTNLNASMSSVKTQTDKLTFDSDNFILSDLKAIEGQLTSGNNATLYLKQLHVQNADDDAVVFQSIGADGRGMRVEGNGSGYGASFMGGADNGAGIGAFGQGTEGGIYAGSTGTGKSIYALQDIAVSDGDLTLANIAQSILKYDWSSITGEAARSVLNALRKLRNKVSFNGSTTLTVYKEDGTTSAYTQTVTTDDTQEPFKELGN